MMNRTLVSGVIAAVIALPCGYASAQGKDDKQAKPAAGKDNNEAKRTEIQKMASDTLTQLYKAQPAAKEKVEKAAGYGVFSNFGLTILFVGGAGGKGMVHDNASKKVTYMNMGQAQAGLSVGAAKYKSVFIFKDAKTLQTFIDKGWDAGGQAGAVAKAGQKGVADTVGTSSHAGIEIIQLGENGAIVGGTVAGTKYWKDGDLN